MANQWYTLFDAGRAATNNLVSDVKKLNEYEQKKLKEQEEEEKRLKEEEERDGVPHPRKPQNKAAIKIKKVIKYVEKPVNYFISSVSFFTLILATGLLIWQLVGKVESYINNPVQVSTTYSYPPNVPFPGVILCNTKPLRISYVGPLPMMSVINYFNLLDDNSTYVDYLKNVNEANKLNMTEFYLNATQPKEDFILQCTWPDGSNCSSNQMEAVITDYGVCYRLKTESIPDVSYSGSANGLVIMLNIATYDNIKGPEKTIGAKLALYDKSNTPVVTQVGVDSPPGFQTAVGIETQITSRLAKDKKGNCEPKAFLQLYKNYSYQACRMEQSFLQVIKDCNCRPYNMPDEKQIMHTQYSLCNAEQQFDCVYNRMSSPIKIDPETCPETCLTTSYSMLMSYSQIAVDNVVETLEKMNQLDKMKSGYERALDTRSQFEAETKVGFENKVNKLLNMYNTMNNAGLEPSTDFFKELKTRLNEKVPCYIGEFSWKQNATITVADVLSAKQPTLVRNSLTIIQTVVQSLAPTFNYTYLLFPTLDQYQIARDNQQQSDNQLANNPALENDSAFSAQHKTAQQQAAQLLSQIQTALSGYYTNDYQNFMNSLNGIADNVTKFSSGDLLAVNASILASTIRLTVNESQVCLSQASLSFQNAIASVINASFDIANLKAIMSDNEQKLLSCQFNLDKVANAVGKYYNTYSSVLSAYQGLLIDLDSYKVDQYQFYSKLNSEQVVTFTDNDYFDIRAFCDNYASNKSDRATLSQILTSSYSDYWLILQDHFTRIRTQLLNNRILVDNFVNKINNFITNKDSRLLVLANADFLRNPNATTLTRQCTTNVQSAIFAQATTLVNITNQWRQAFDSLISDCTAYQASFKIGNSFYSTNIVIYNIYFNDLTVTKISQFLTYSSVGMLSDIAGIVGVILGFLGTTGVALYSTMKSMRKMAVEKFKARFGPQQKGDQKPLDGDSKTKTETVVVVVEEVVEHDHTDSVPYMESGTVLVGREEAVETNGERRQSRDLDKSTRHEEESSFEEKMNRINKKIKKEGKLPKLEIQSIAKVKEIE